MSANHTASEAQPALPDGLIPRSGFARYQFAADDHEVLSLSVRRSPADAGVQVSWPPYRQGGDADALRDEPSVIYRLVSTEGRPGHSPDNAYLIESTEATTACDPRPLTGAVRHLQVWVNIGRSVAEALVAQPTLHAAGLVIARPQDVEIRDDFGRVVGQWSVLPGVRAVYVYRVPAELAKQDGPQFRILAQHGNLSGFVDDAAERGHRYLYRVRCEVEVDGTARLSDAVQIEVTVSARPEPVTDMALTDRRAGPAGGPDGAVVDLAWTPPPSGRVLVFRTQTPPSADAQTIELDESVLDQVGLGTDQQLVQPVSEQVGRDGARTATMDAVPWPPQWTRAYFTPVTVVNGRARLGHVVSSVRTAAITDAQITEYCSKQMLTFGWPAGAATVLVYIAPKGYDAADGLTGRCYEIARDDYDRFGGMKFAGELPGQGCSLHLVPVAYTAGRRVDGAVTSIEYGGLLRLWYDVRLSRDRKARPLTAAVRVRAEGNVIGSPPFVLVHNAERLPLDVSDGRPIDVTRVDSAGEPTGTPVKEFQTVLGGDDDDVWCGDVRGKAGWIRLFAHLPPERLRRLAVLDPPVQSLWLGPEAAQR